MTARNQFLSRALLAQALVAFAAAAAVAQTTEPSPWMIPANSGPSYLTNLTVEMANDAKAYREKTGRNISWMTSDDVLIRINNMNPTAVGSEKGSLDAPRESAKGFFTGRSTRPSSDPSDFNPARANWFYQSLPAIVINRDGSVGAQPVLLGVGAYGKFRGFRVVVSDEVGNPAGKNLSTFHKWSRPKDNKTKAEFRIGLMGNGRFQYVGRDKKTKAFFLVDKVLVENEGDRSWVTHLQKTLRKDIQASDIEFIGDIDNLSVINAAASDIEAALAPKNVQDPYCPPGPAKK